MTHQHYIKPRPPPEALFGSFAPLQVKKTFRIDSLANFTIELGATQDGGTVRKAFSTATYKNDPEMLRQFRSLADATMDRLGDVPGLQFIVSTQPFGQFITSRATTSGGNFLGLDAEDGNRVLICLTVDWKNQKDDEMVDAAIQRLIELGNMEARRLNALDDVFLNYAAPWQNPYGGVGQKNLEAYMEVSRMYDPLQLFQKAVPGGFKLV